MDPFEEFEFKPLTNGLGFHKKSAELKKQMTESVSLRESKSSSDIPTQAPSALLEEFESNSDSPEPKTQQEAYADLLRALEQPVGKSHLQSSGVELDVSEPLPRDKKEAMEISIDNPEISHQPQWPEADDMPDMVEKSETEPTFEEKRAELMSKTSSRGASNSPKLKLLEATSVSFSAAIVDVVFVLALSLIFLVSLLMVTGVDLSSVIFNSQSDLTTQVSLGILYLAVMQMYVIVSRSFFGKTLGEWTFDLQLGRDEDIDSASYPLKVLWRSIVSVLTGVVLLPLLSFLFRTDIGAKLSGLQLYRQKG